VISVSVRLSEVGSISLAQAYLPIATSKSSSGYAVAIISLMFLPFCRLRVIYLWYLMGTVRLSKRLTRASFSSMYLALGFMTQYCLVSFSVYGLVVTPSQLIGVLIVSN